MTWEAGTRAKRAVMKLLPRGRAWAKHVGSELDRFGDALAAEFHRVETRALELVDEFAPDRAIELLPRWEHLVRTSSRSRNADLPTRRASVIARLVPPEDLSLEQLILDAAELGYTLTIVPHTLFVAGVSRAGQRAPTEGWVYVLDVFAPRGATDEALRELLEDRVLDHEILRLTWDEPGA